jgi:oligopeptide/dipeptide ABC transporter ATP-binding protein
MTDALLEVYGLTAGFPAGDHWVAAVDDVSFRIGRGESLALVGESGSGKTLTASCLVRLVPPPGRILGGSIRFEDRELRDLPEREMTRVRGARIGFVFQEPLAALNPVMTIGRQIEEVLRAHALTSPVPRARALELLEEVRMDDPARRLDEYPHQLSGGLRQRALIAIALACRPALLIADEPTTALDVTLQAELLDLLKRLRENYALALLFITHDLAVVSRDVDRVAVMYAGRIVEEGPAANVLASPRHPYTRGLIRSQPGGGTGRLAAIAGAMPLASELPSGCVFAPRCPERFEPCGSKRPALYAAAPNWRARCFLETSHGGEG